jgi:DNA-binding transcriptional ArsR family regulator
VSSIDDKFILDGMVEEVLAHAPKAQPYKSPEISEDIFQEDPIETMMPSITRLFVALGSEIRMEIISELRGRELAAGDLALLLEAPESSLSHHLRILEQARVIQVTRQGRHKYYRVTPEVTPLLQAALKLAAEPN